MPQPKNVLKIWQDKSRIWVEYQTIHGPVVMDYPPGMRTVLAVLDLLEAHGMDTPYQRQIDNVPDVKGFTTADKASAYNTLKKMGLI